jgi:hypothetical protein
MIRAEFRVDMDEGLDTKCLRNGIGDVHNTASPIANGGIDYVDPGF